MYCTKCSNYVTTAGEVRACATCAAMNDGTARQVPADLKDNAAIETVITRAPGLGNRFVHGDPPPAPDVVKDPEAERIQRDERAQRSADTESAQSRYPNPFDAQTKTTEELKGEKVEQELREDRARAGVPEDNGTQKRQR